MKLVILGSGSSGNCTYLESGTTRLLIDAGFGSRSLDRRLRESGLHPRGIDAVLVTHGHSDHVSGVTSVVRKYGCPIHATPGTRLEASVLAGIDSCEMIVAGRQFEIGGFRLEAFPTPHDAAEPVGFLVECEGIRGALATDLGEITEEIAQCFRGCDWLVLESNHDEELLRIGPYPWELKRRVLGRRGHLSNEALARFLLTQFDGGALHLFLAHLSRQNNLPELAYDSASKALRERALEGLGNGVQVHLTDQIKPSIVVNL